MRIVRLSISLLAMATMVKAGAEAKPSTSFNTGIPSSPIEIIKLFFFGGQAQRVEPQEALVIGAGFGRTSTSSLIAAFQALGLNSYHFSAVVRNPSHLRMWAEHFEDIENGGEGMADKLLDELSASGFNATTSFPACFLYKEMMERYPNAKVVLSVRSDGDGNAWADSVLGSILNMRLAVERVPFRWLPNAKYLRPLLSSVFRILGAPFQESPNGNIQLPKKKDLANMYDSWIEQVKATVPPEKLLIFPAKDGWKPLCDFVSPLDQNVANRCQEILEAGTPYPRVNERKFVQRILFIIGTVSTIFERTPFVVVALAALWLLKRMKVKSKQA